MMRGRPEARGASLRGVSWSGQEVSWRGTLTRSDGIIRVGICAREKKATSTHMLRILSKFDPKKFEVVQFGDDCILNKDVEEWPVVDALIAFHSDGFPIDKAEKYVELRKPHTINDLGMQREIQDRRKVYDKLREIDVEVPRNAYASRDGYNGSNPDDLDISEYDEYVMINGVKISKPFVEKPVNAEDHNIYIYYPMSAGGGSKRLFRKVGDKSSEFYAHENSIRRDGSYIYEAFVETQGTDVKVYTVGTDYGHAEARKSPTLDGKVNRDSQGKEIRFPIILSLEEKEVARRVTLGFKQCVCGFDILRVDGRSYVCDVNGWSFVKNSRKYNEDSAMLLCEFLEAAVKPSYNRVFSAAAPLLKYARGSISRRASPSSASSLDSRGTSAGGGLSCRGSVSPPPGSASPASPPTRGPGEAAKGGPEDRVERQERAAREGSPLVWKATRGGERDVNEYMSSDGSSNGFGDKRGKRKADASEGQSGTQDTGSTPARAHPEELLCVIAVTRHGDRTPKQKMKMKVALQPYLDYYHRHSSDHTKELKVKHKHGLREFLSVTVALLERLEASPPSGEGGEGQDAPGGTTQQCDEQTKTNLYNIRHVLERWKITGINRKLQLKPTTWEVLPEEEEGGEEEGEELQDEADKAMKRTSSMESISLFVDTGGGGTSTRRASTTREREEEAEAEAAAADKSKKRVKATQLQLVLKWGGELTSLGARQAIELGNHFRKIVYPDISGGGGLLRLHSTFRHDLKITTSDEGRVMKTAAAFSKGFLELEGELTPLLVSLVHKDKANLMLDHSGNKDILLKDHLAHQKKILENVLNTDMDLTTDENIAKFCPAGQRSVIKALRKIKNPYKKLTEMRLMMADIVQQLEELVLAYPDPNAYGRVEAFRREQDRGDDEVRYCLSKEALEEDAMLESLPPHGSNSPESEGKVRRSSSIEWETRPHASQDDADEKLGPGQPARGESLMLALDRWRTLLKELYDAKKDKFDVTKLPDVHDTVRYDALHNAHLGLRGMSKLYDIAKDIADYVVPQEYGMTVDEKLHIGSKMCNALLEKMRKDLIIGRSSNASDMRYNLDSSHAEDLTINSLERRVRTRLYFTSESHLHTLLNILRFPIDGMEPLCTKEAIKKIGDMQEMCYLTSFVIRVFEDSTKAADDPQRFRGEILFTPGVDKHPTHRGDHLHTVPLISLHKHLTCEHLESVLEAAIALGNRGLATLGEEHAEASKPAKPEATT